MNPETQGRAVLGRAARVQPRGARGAPAPDAGRRGADLAGNRNRPAPGAEPRGRGNEPLPVRPPGRPAAGLPVRRSAGGRLPGARQRAADRPGRSAGRGAAGRRAGSAGRAERGGRRPRGGGPRAAAGVPTSARRTGRTAPDGRGGAARAVCPEPRSCATRGGHDRCACRARACRRRRRCRGTRVPAGADAVSAADELRVVLAGAASGVDPGRLARRHGASALLRATPSVLERMGALPALVDALWLARDSDAGAYRRDLAARGISCVTVSDESYPARLRELHDPPLALFALGPQTAALDPQIRSAAIVGSRRAAEGGLRLAERLARAVASSGGLVVSGLALGI